MIMHISHTLIGIMPVILVKLIMVCFYSGAPRWRLLILPGSARLAASRRPPHWRVIERITTAEVLTRAGDEHAAQTMLTAAIGDAESLRLPHQVQRVIRLTSEPGVLTGHAVHQQAQTALTRLERELTSKTGLPGSGAAARPLGITAGQA
jgi:hypothetical protein